MQQKFPETFLHYIWKLKLFEFENIQTTNNLPLEILKIGEHNHHAGPDFANGRIKIGDTLWAGSVEIHKKSSDWIAHKHSEDKAYDNTILHVVYEHDSEIYRTSGEAIPTLELKGKIPVKYIERYWRLIHNNYWIPCQTQLGASDGLMNDWQGWLDRLIAERLEQKAALVKIELKQTQNSWEETFYRLLARAFGVKQNTNPFEALAKSLPLKILAKHKQSLMQLEALLFGQAGFLEVEYEEEYPQQLQKEYKFLQKKYQLVTLQASSWKFGRMRPAAFPTIRLAQFAKLIYQSVHLFSKILAENNPKKLAALFEVELDGYWLDHYRLGEPSTQRKKSIGKGTIQLFLINTVAPVVFEYGKHIGQKKYQEKATQLLKSLPAEKNSIISKWKDLGVPVVSALDSQALLYLKNNYCTAKKCLNCAIGNKIIQTKEGEV